ncbi:hypothetical protein, partial [Halomonas sp. 707D7]
GQVIAEIGEKLLGDSIPRGFADASEILRDAIERSNAHLEAGNEGNVSLQLGNGVTTDLLAQAIEQYQTAEQALEDFLEANDTDADTIEAGYVSAADALGDLIGDGENDEGLSNFVGRSAAAQDGQIAAAQAAANADVELAASAIDNRTVVNAINLVYTRNAAQEDAESALEAATTARGDALVAFNGGAEGTGTAEFVGNTLTIDNADGAAVVVAAISANGTWVATNEAAQLVEDNEAFQSLLTAANAQVVAQTAFNTADAQLTAAQEAATAAIENAEVDGTLIESYTEALEARQVLSDAVSAFQEARDLNDQLDALTEARDNALAVIANDYEFELTVLAEGETALTAGETNDLYVFDDVTGSDNAITIAGLGDAGTDYLYFGEGYTAVALGEGEITDRVGSASALEIFWKQDGDNLVLYVEADATAGNSTSAADITEITLTGVNVADVDFSNGFLSVNNAA